MDSKKIKPIVSKWLWITLIVVVFLAGGYFTWYFLKGSGKKVASTKNTVNSTTDWKKYLSYQYNYSFNYPTDWFLYNTDSKDVRVQPQKDCDRSTISASECPIPGPEASAFEVVVENNPNNISLKQFIEQKEGTVNRQYKDTVIDGINALKVTGTEGLGAGDWSIYLTKGSNVYELRQNMSDENTFNQIVSTFLFTK